MTENDIIWSGKWCLLMTFIDIYFLLFNNYSLFLRNPYINTVKYDQIISFPFSSSFYIPVYLVPLQFYVALHRTPIVVNTITKSNFGRKKCISSYNSQVIIHH